MSGGSGGDGGTCDEWRAVQKGEGWNIGTQAQCKRNDIDFYAITVEDRFIVRDRIYYKIARPIASIGIEFFDRAVTEKKLICFSAGKEGDKFVKYDFSLRNADLHELESYLLSEHSYYRADKVKMLKNFLSESNTAYDNHVLGIRVDAATGKRCVAVCQYFRLQKSGSTCFAEKFTDDAVVSVLGCRSAFFYPRCGDERLHMTALDFAPEAFKLKFYAEYDVPKRAYDLPSEFFDRSVQDKLNSVIKKGYELQFIQTAISENKAVTYNLYFKPCA